LLKDVRFFHLGVYLSPAKGFPATSATIPIPINNDRDEAATHRPAIGQSDVIGVPSYGSGGVDGAVSPHAARARIAYAVPE
jgi:hypothetical protein